jgi:hypothetical protein
MTPATQNTITPRTTMALRDRQNARADLITGNPLPS